VKWLLASCLEPLRLDHEFHTKLCLFEATASVRADDPLRDPQRQVANDLLQCGHLHVAACEAGRYEIRFFRSISKFQSNNFLCNT